MKTLSLFTLCLALGSGLAAYADDVPAGAQTPTPDHLVYLSFLPEPSELMADAKANGLEILRLDKTADRVVVTYKYPDGRVATLGYARLGTAGSNDRVVARTEPRSTAVYTQDRTVIVKEEPEVVYVEREPVVVRERVVYRDNFWTPLTVGLGLGYISGHHHHYYPRYTYHNHWRHGHTHRSHHSSHRGHHGHRKH